MLQGPDYSWTSVRAQAGWLVLVFGRPATPQLRPFTLEFRRRRLAVYNA